MPADAGAGRASRSEPMLLQASQTDSPVPAGALVAQKAARRALDARRRGSRDAARELYYDAFSLLRALRRHFADQDWAA